MPARERGKYLFPWRDGNRFELLVDGRQFFPRMLESIEKAHRYVLLEIYLFESGAVATRFIDAFVRAASHGVKVKLLLDDFGALGLSPQDRERLIQGGVELLLYNPIHLSKHLRNMFRDHRKLLIVDGEVAFVSGAGITDEFDFPEDPEQSWRETAACIRGPVLADWQELFVHLWNRHAPNPLELPVPAPPAEADDMRGRVTVTTALARQDIKRSLYNRVRHAQRRVWLATAYFVPSRKVRARSSRQPGVVRTCGCCCPARTPITRRSATPDGASTPVCCGPIYAFSNTSRVFCTPKQFSVTTGFPSAQATSTAGICAGTLKPIRK